MEQFSLPLTSFDVRLLPTEARDLGSAEFREAVAEFFRCQFRDLGANGQVTVTSERISVTWVTPNFQPVEAALSKLRRGQLRDGIQLLELIRSRRPDDADVLYNLGVAWSELGDPARAESVLRRLLEKHPDHLRGQVALGVALGRLGDLVGAEQTFRGAVEQDGSDPWAQKNLGGILIRQGRAAEARPHLEAAVSVAPQDAQAWYLLGEATRQTGDIPTARVAYRKSRDLDPNGVGELSERALNQLATDKLLRNAEGVNPEALSAMESAVRRLRALTPQAGKELTLKAALLGQHGLRLTDPSRVHFLDGITEPLTALEVASLIHAGVQMASPGAETGLPLEREYQATLTKLR